MCVAHESRENMEYTEPRAHIMYSTEPWAKVADNIYIGGTFKLEVDRYMRAAVLTNKPEGFDAVVSMAQCAATNKVGASIHIAFPIVDGPVNPDDVPQLERIVDTVVELAAQGAKVLIRCRAGCNRSALIAAWAMYNTGGRNMDEIIDHIRSVRSCALSNPLFVKFLEER